MLKKILFGLILCFLPFSSFSQDSTRIEFKRIDALCRKHLRTPDSLLFYSQKLLKFSKEHNLDFGKKKALRSIGSAYSRLRNFQKANQYYYKALNSAKLSNDKRLEYILFNDLALNHRATSYLDSAFYYFRKLIYHYEQTQEKLPLNMTYMNMGITFLHKSKIDSAEIYLIKSAKGFKGMNNFRFISNNMSLLGEIYYQKGDYKKALIYADSSQNLSEKIKYRTNYSRNYNLLARIHEKLKNEGESKKYSKLEFTSKPKNIDFKNARILNESHAKSRYDYNRKKMRSLIDDKSFYKTNLFKMIALAIFLFFFSYYLYIKHKKTQKEVCLLQKELDIFSKNKVIKTRKLIHLKSKAVIDVYKLMYIKSDGHYLEFYIEGKGKPEIDRNSLVNILEQLPSQLFVRTHNSYIVNVSYIKIINSTKVMLSNNKWINLSRTFKQQLKDILHKD